MSVKDIDYLTHDPDGGVFQQWLYVLQRHMHLQKIREEQEYVEIHLVSCGC